jgi:hypothetical protein
VNRRKNRQKYGYENSRNQSNKPERQKLSEHEICERQFLKRKKKDTSKLTNKATPKLSTDAD